MVALGQLKHAMKGKEHMNSGGNCNSEFCQLEEEGQMDNINGLLP
jgi:hypothetical protein